MNRTLETVRALVERLHPHPTHVTVQMARHGAGLCEQSRVSLVFDFRSPLALVGEGLLTITRALEAEGLAVQSIGQSGAAIRMTGEDGATAMWRFLPSFEVVVRLEETPSGDHGR